MRQVGRLVQCRQNRRGRTAATWPFLISDTERMTSGRRHTFRPEDCPSLLDQSLPPKTIIQRRPSSAVSHEGQVLLHGDSREEPRGVREILHDPPRDEGARAKYD